MKFYSVINIQCKIPACESRIRFLFTHPSVQVGINELKLHVFLPINHRRARFIKAFNYVSHLHLRSTFYVNFFFFLILFWSGEEIGFWTDLIDSSFQPHLTKLKFYNFHNVMGGGGRNSFKFRFARIKKGVCNDEYQVHLLLTFGSKIHSGSRRQ